MIDNDVIDTYRDISDMRVSLQLVQLCWGGERLAVEKVMGRSMSSGIV